MQKKSSRIRFVEQKKSKKIFQSIRFIKIGLWPGFGSNKACIRLQGRWLIEAGFVPQWQVKVTVSKDKLVLEPIKPTTHYIEG